MARKNTPVVLVTGGYSGIGLAVVHRFAQQRYNVILCGRNAEKGKRAAKRLQAKYKTEIVFVPADVGKEEAVHRLMEQGPGRFGRLDVLCNNAGIQKLGPVEDMPVSVWDEVVAVNARSAFLCTKFALAYIKKVKGCIINVASTGGLVGYAGGTAYCVSKAALVMLTKVLALELAHAGIRVNCVCPGAVKTPMVQKETLRDLASKIPLGRVGHPRDVGDLVFYLASGSSKQITGGVFVLDGGVTAGRPRLA